MFLHGLAFSFPAWRPHFSLLDTPLANEMMLLRWLHLVFGVIWIGLLYFFNLSLVGKWFGWWFLVWLVAYVFLYALQLPAKGILNSPWVRIIGIVLVVSAASWLDLALNGGPNVSNPHLAISIGGGLGLIMLLNTWGVVWRVQKRLIGWARASAEKGVPLPPEAERLMRWNYLTARTSFWLSFPMLFFMGAASHYPFLSTIPR